MANFTEKISDDMRHKTSDDYSSTPVQETTVQTERKLISQPILWIFVTMQGCVGVYIFVAMLYFQCKSKASTITTSQKQAKRLRNVCLSATILGLSFFIVTEITLFTVNHQRSCVVRVSIQKVSYCAGIFNVYLFLWLRQKLFYSNPSLAYLYTTGLRLWSWAVFVMVIFSFLAQSIMTVLGIVLSAETSTTPAGDCSMSDSRLWMTQLTLGATTSAVVHISLMCLFLYPLLRHRSQTSTLFVQGRNGSFMSRSSFPSSPNINCRSPWIVSSSVEQTTVLTTAAVGITTPTNERSRSAREKRKKQKLNARLYFLIKRCFILTVVCVVANLFATIITALFFRGGLLASFLYGWNMLINLFCCTGCFSNWRRIIFPFCNRCSSRYGISFGNKSGKQTTDSKMLDSIV